MDRKQVMTTPKLTPEEYSSVVSKWNRRVRRGVVESCVTHTWARLPQDHDDDPQLICVDCMRPYRPSQDRVARPMSGMGAMPPVGRTKPI